LSGDVKLLYVAPESLTKEENLNFLLKANISLVAIDEAHCISEWGHDFRPEYRKIRGIIENLGNLPVIALTATATPKVQQDIQRNLQMEEADLFKSSFNRKNLYYEVRPKVDAKKQLIKYVKTHQGKAGIIYCLSRKKVEEIAELLVVNGVKARPYHAGLEGQQRMENQDAFLNEEVDVIVATIAFGMGIDKPDVRFVIHYDAPKSLEGYYQETGRAGRDGLEGNCVMFYSYNDILKLEKFNKDKPVTERDNARYLLQEMVNYAESGVCRRRQLLHYFGEYMDKDCNFCDNDLKATEKFQAQEDVWLALKTAIDTEQRFGIGHIADVVRGITNEYVKSYGHDKLQVFGKGKFKTRLNAEGEEITEESTEQYWNSLIRQITVYNFLEKDIENFGVLKITEKGLNFLEASYPILLCKDHDYSSVSEEDEEEKEMPAMQTKAHDQVLFDMLKGLRRKVAKEKNLPPYVIFQDPSLEEMATTYPTTHEEMSQVNGVGMGKVQKFGQPFLDAIIKYIKDNEIETATEVVVKSAVNRSKIKIFIIQQVDRKVDLEDIAESKDLSLADLLEEIEHICYSGTRLNLDYYINQVMDGDKQDEIYDYFMHAETDSMKVALDELGEDFTEEELRLMRIKFISEVAN
ncbi:MAG: RecQ family ATP-dependent DNA helicase, partial [Verrucomicrobia bacterium]|nr:RecQ family ATP-dependent DNA helicase [Cytophagales bacterium]